MVRRLDRLARRPNPVHNIFLRGLRARMFAEQAAQATTQDKRMELMFQEAVEWLQAGASEKALEGFNAWEAMAREVASELYEKTTTSSNFIKASVGFEWESRNTAWPITRGCLSWQADPHAKCEALLKSRRRHDRDITAGACAQIQALFTDGLIDIADSLRLMDQAQQIGPIDRRVTIKAHAQSQTLIARGIPSGQILVHQVGDLFEIQCQVIQTEVIHQSVADLHATDRFGPYVNGQPAVDDFLIIVFLDDFRAIEIHDGLIGMVVKGVNQVVPICQAHGFQ